MSQMVLTGTDIAVSLGIGLILCLIYFYLLWQTIGISHKSSRPGIILFLSATLRIFLLIFISLVFSQNSVGKFLLIFCGFFLTRVILLKIMKPSFKKEIQTSEIVYHDTQAPVTKGKKGSQKPSSSKQKKSTGSRAKNKGKKKADI